MENNKKSSLEENKDLIDIRTVNIDTELPKEKRIENYIQQIKNPYQFRCGKMVVQIFFADTEVTLDECLKQYIRMVE